MKKRRYTEDDHDVPRERRSGSHGKRREKAHHDARDAVPFELARRDPSPAGDDSTAAERSDAVAREAARRLEDGKSASVHDAIEAATRDLDAWDVPRPSRGRVREHARSIAMEELGEAGYYARVADVWRIAAELMEVLESGLRDVDTVLVGRAARGQIDGGIVIHIRAYTERPVSDLAEVLVEHGYEEPDFETVETRIGPLQQLRLTEDERELAITRVPRAHSTHPGTDLVIGKSIEFVDLETLLARLEAGGEAE